MTPKKVRVSMYQQILHEFRTAIRRAHFEGMSRSEIEGNLLKLIQDNIKDLAKMTAGLLILAVAVENLRQGDLLAIKTSFIELSIPAVYCAFLGAVLWLGLVISLLTQAQYLSAKVVSEYVFHKWRRFASAEWALSGCSFFDVTSPLRNGHFFKIKQPFLGALYVFFSLAFVIISIPVFGSAWSLFTIALSELSAGSSAYLGKSLAISTVALMVLPVVYAIIYFVPFPILKNTSTIRWNFLSTLVWGTSRLHPQAKRWLGKQA
jgi:hypothetical protein